MNKRRTFALALAALLLVVPTAQAATRVVTFYPVGLLQDTITGEYEWATARDASSAVQLSVARVASPEGSTTNIAGGFGIRRYLHGQALDGIYLGGGITLVSTSKYDAATSLEESTFVLGLGGRAGYKLPVADALLVDLGINLSLPIYASETSGDANTTTIGAGPFNTGISLGLGLTW